MNAGSTKSRKKRGQIPSQATLRGGRNDHNGQGAGSRSQGASRFEEDAKRKAAPPEPRRELSERWQYALVLAVVVFIIVVRVRLLNFPLERDEGEYAYAGQLILQGIPPYELAYNMKLPGTYFAYAAILYFFGQTPAAIHLGLLIVNVATIGLVFLLTKRIFGPTAGVVACASYAVLTISPGVLGFAGHATHFVMLPAMAGLLVLMKAIESKKLWQFVASGALLGLGFLAKQPGAFLLLFGGLYLVKSEWGRPLQLRTLATRAGAFGLGAIAPLGVTCLVLYRAGVFGKFWFWTFSYASAYGAILSAAGGMERLSITFPHLFILTIGIWVLAAVGLCTVIWSRKLRPHAVFSVGFLVFSFAAVSAGWYYRPHYFVLMLPAVAMLAGVGVSAMGEKLGHVPGQRVLKYVPVGFFVLSLAFSIFVLRQYLFDVDPALASHMVYGLEPFPEALKVADYIRTHSPEGARVVVMGSEPEIYFYSHRHSATGYIYMYALLEEQKYALTMQKEMIKEIEAAHPEYLVVVKGPPSQWGVSPGSEMMIFNWAQKYVVENYTLTGAVDVGYQSAYHWGSELQNAQLISPVNVLVFKRKS